MIIGRKPPASLTQRTTQATQEVGESIKAIQDDTSIAVTQMSEGTDRVSSGVEQAEQAGQSLSEIVARSLSVVSRFTANCLSGGGDEVPDGDCFSW